MTQLTPASLGLAEEQSSELSGEHAQLLGATLDIPFAAGTPLPLLWHWAYFNPSVPSAGLGPDGHAKRDSPMLADYPRRMWVGGEVRSVVPLLTGTPAVRRTRVVDHAVKHGSTGDLLVVSLEHTIEQRDVVAVIERQDVIYRGATGTTAAPGEPTPATAPEGGWMDVVVPSRPVLFRFSALTFNAHRIHYDAAYATEVEHYPGVVVQGPLTAMLLAGSATRHLDITPKSFSFRASAPLFADQEIRLHGSLSDSTATRTATRFDGVTAMAATVS
jgi:3-methylfumaryl-CoA hydratase